MSKSLKVVLGLFGLLIIMMVGVFFFVSTKIQPEQIRKMAIDEISKALPGAKVKLGTIDYSLGTSVSFHAKDFNLMLKKNQKDLFNVKNVEINIPILSILTGGGTIDVKVKRPNMYYQELSAKKTNWTLALPSPKKEQVSTKSESNEATSTSDKKIELPAFVDNSRINLRIENINVFYMPLNKPKSEIHLSKINLKNLNLKSTTAFEIASNVKFALDKNNFFQSNLQVIGEVGIGKFLNEKTLETSVLLDISDTSLTGMSFKIPDLESKAKVLIDPKGVLTSDIQLKLKNLAEAKAEVSLNNNQLRVKSLNLTSNLEDLKKSLPKEIVSSLQMLDFGKANLNIFGSLSMNLESSDLNPDLSIAIKDPVTIIPNNSIRVQSTMNATLKGKDININIINNLFKGSVSLKVKTVFDPLNIPAELDQFKPINVSLLATNLQFSKDFLQQTLYAGESSAKASGPSTTAVADTTPGTQINLPQVNIAIEGKNIFIEKEQTSIDAKVQAFKNRISSKNFTLRYGKGELLLPFDVTLKDTKNIYTNLEMVMKSISFTSLKPLMPPMVSGVSGIFDGKVKGNVNLLQSGVKYQLDIDVKATKGELKDFNVKKIAISIYEGIKDKFPAKYEKLTNRFDKLQVKASVNEKVNKVKKFDFYGENKSMEIKLSGNVFMTSQTSKLIGSIKEAKSAPVIKKATNLSAIPLRITGTGPAVYKVDLGYSLKKLGKGTTNVVLKNTKKKLNKQSKKLNKQAKKKIDKAKKRLEEEAKKKLKNLIKF